MKARVTVTLKNGVLDPQGKAIEGALKSLGVDGVANVRQGKVFDIELGHGRSGPRRGHRSRRPARSCWRTRSSRITASRSREAAMKSAVIVFPGSNREGDVAAGARASRIDGRESLARRDRTAGRHRPRGAAGRLFLRRLPALRRHRRRGRTSWTRCGRHAARGGLVLGICNGFQILCESGLLPGILMRNANLKFICHRQSPAGRAQRHRRSPSATRKGQVIDVCVAHGEGNYMADAETLRRLEGDGLVAFRYCDARRRSHDRLRTPTAR